VKTEPKKFPQPGTGVIGFGCMFIFLMIAFLPTIVAGTKVDWAVTTGIAVIVGLVAARFGEPVFEKVIHWFGWWL
jgi:hypothetical protein